jgi:ABC-2 type transport system permease protein
LAYLPAILVLMAVVILADGWQPRWTGLGWLALSYCPAVGWLGGLLHPPAWMLDVSPFEHTARAPEEAWRVGAPAVLLALVVSMVDAGAAGLRRRDIA